MTSLLLNGERGGEGRGGGAGGGGGHEEATVEYRIVRGNLFRRGTSSGRVKPSVERCQ